MDSKILKIVRDNAIKQIKSAVASIGGKSGTVSAVVDNYHFVYLDNGYALASFQKDDVTDASNESYTFHELLSESRLEETLELLVRLDTEWRNNTDYVLLFPFKLGDDYEYSHIKEMATNIDFEFVEFGAEQNGQHIISLKSNSDDSSYTFIMADGVYRLINSYEA